MSAQYIDLDNVTGFIVEDEYIDLDDMLQELEDDATQDTQHLALKDFLCLYLSARRELSLDNNKGLKALIKWLQPIEIKTIDFELPELFYNWHLMELSHYLQHAQERDGTASHTISYYTVDRKVISTVYSLLMELQGIKVEHYANH